MNIRSHVTFEHTFNDKLFTFSIPFGATYDEAFDVALMMSKAVRELQKTAQEAQEKKDAEEAQKGE